MNGLYVGDAGTEKVKSEIASTGNVLHLVLARHKSAKSKVTKNRCPAHTYQKEIT